jgi:CRISPR-associated endonuclease Cas1
MAEEGPNNSALWNYVELGGTERLYLLNRSSLLSHAAARHAVDAAHAFLNYAYAILEGQTRQALSVAGFDLACGFLHADHRGRDALVYDLMEVARPVVDDCVLTLLQTTTFQASDFTESRMAPVGCILNWRGQSSQCAVCHSLSWLSTQLGSDRCCTANAAAER